MIIYISLKLDKIDILDKMSPICDEWTNTGIYTCSCDNIKSESYNDAFGWTYIKDVGSLTLNSTDNLTGVCYNNTKYLDLYPIYCVDLTTGNFCGKFKQSYSYWSCEPVKKCSREIMIYKGDN